jgi:hypothetical protein
MPSQATNKRHRRRTQLPLNADESVGFPNIDGATGVGFHILGTGEGVSGLGFFGSAGYRMAKIDDTQFDSQSTAQVRDRLSASRRAGFGVLRGALRLQPLR